MNKNEFLVLRCIFDKGTLSIRNIASLTGLSLGSIHSIKKSLEIQKLISNNTITESGIKALEQYRVKSAVIMAAGMSTRLAPLSFEKPEGLFKVKDEVLIERQIKQLIEAGIDNIVLVLGYKKESFFYLGDKYNVKIIINSSFETKNNSETVYLARDYISNSYICSSDNYFVNNPFSRYEYESFVATEDFEEASDGYYLLTGHKDKIIGRRKGVFSGLMYKGMMHWDDSFSESIIHLLDSHHKIDDLSQDSIYSVIFNHLNILPPIYSNLYKANTIFKFYNLNELRKFDEKYIENTSSEIMKNISTTLGCKENDICDFSPIKEGLTNTSYIFNVKGKKYVYRHPGDGTEKIINRTNENNSLILAKELGIDPTFIKMDPKKGWKISFFADGCREPDYSNFEDSKLVINKMRELHHKNAKVDWLFEPWYDSLKMERIVKRNQGIEMPDFEQLKKDIYRIYLTVENDGLTEKCFCHCDTYKPNWLIRKDNEVVLIDWEYAGLANPAVDVAYYIVDAMYDYDDALRFIKEYLKEDSNQQMIKHFMAYIPIVAYYWFVWALFRESCSALMGESLYNWYYIAKKYSKYYLENYCGQK